MRLGDGCWAPMLQMAAHGNMASRSDLEVGGRALETGIWGAWKNVLINMGEIQDEAFRTRVAAEAASLAARAAEQRDAVLARLEERASAT